MKQSIPAYIHHILEDSTGDPLKHKMDYPILMSLPDQQDFAGFVMHWLNNFMHFIACWEIFHAFFFHLPIFFKSTFSNNYFSVK